MDDHHDEEKRNKQPVKRKETIELTSTMMGRIIDENLIARYGTSLTINMGKEYQKFLDKRYGTLKKEFERINKDQDEGIDADELQFFLNLYEKDTGKKFEKEYCGKLFDIMDSDKSKKISIQEFVTTYIVLEEKLKLKQISFVKAREDLIVVKEKYIKGESSNKDERLNEGGVSYTAVLNICVIEASDLKPLDFIGKSDPYVILKLEDSIEKSSYKPDTLDPFWNEDFVFNVKNKDAFLRVEVYDKDTIGEDDLEGVVEIPLSDLAHQQKIENWYNLKNENGEEEPGRIKLRLHFVWSLHQYFVDMLRKTDEKIHKIEENLGQLNTFLEHIEKPFGILLFVEIDDRVEKLLVGDSEELLNPVQTRKTVAMPNKQKSNYVTVIEDVFRGTLKKSSIEWSEMTKICMFSILSFTCITLLGRSDFLNLVIGIAIWLIFIKEAKYDVTEYLSKFLNGLILTIVYDILWLYFHSKGYWNSEFNSTIRKLSLFFSYLNLIAKCILLFTLWFQNQKIKMKNNREKEKEKRDDLRMSKNVSSYKK